VESRLRLLPRGLRPFGFLEPPVVAVSDLRATLSSLSNGNPVVNPRPFATNLNPSVTSVRCFFVSPVCRTEARCSPQTFRRQS
jgi:hypothetical protein